VPLLEASFFWNPQGLRRNSSFGSLIFLEPSGLAQEFLFWEPHFPGTLRACTGVPLLGASFSWNPQGLHRNSSSGSLIFLEPSGLAQEFLFREPHFSGTLRACTGIPLPGASFSWNSQGLRRNFYSGSLIFLEPSGLAQEFLFCEPHFSGTLRACTGIPLL